MRSTYGIELGPIRLKADLRPVAAPGRPKTSRKSRKSLRHAARVVVWGLAALVLVLVAGCSFREAALQPIDRPERSTLPPNDRDRLADMFDEDLERFGLRLTRGALIDISGDDYEPSDEGTHLALYVEPTSVAYSGLDYLENLVPLTKVFLPEVFDRWPGLMSFDVCQEPPGALNSDEEPPPETQINVSRVQSDAIDWGTVDDTDLLAAAFAEPPQVRLVISKRLRGLPAYDDLVAKVEAETGLTPPESSD
jgi:hypothetical protein